MGPFSGPQCPGRARASCLQARQNLGAVPASGLPLGKRPGLAPCFDGGGVFSLTHGSSVLGPGHRAGRGGQGWAGQSVCPGACVPGPRRCPVRTGAGVAESSFFRDRTYAWAVPWGPGAGFRGPVTFLPVPPEPGWLASTGPQR